MGESIRVLVVDDHPVVRRGIKSLLAEEKDLEVVGEAANGKDAIQQAANLHPDVILMDLVMPEMTGVEAIQKITASNPEARILVMTSFAADDKVFPAIKAGALGYLLKESTPEDLVQAIRQIHRGESSLHPTVARRVLQEIMHPPDRPPTPNPLTAREAEVLSLVAQGLSNQDIARKLNNSDPTVRTHVSNILGKLQLATRIQAALYALREGLVELDPGAEQADKG